MLFEINKMQVWWTLRLWKDIKRIWRFLVLLPTLFTCVHGELHPCLCVYDTSRIRVMARIKTSRHCFVYIFFSNKELCMFSITKCCGSVLYVSSVLLFNGISIKPSTNVFAATIGAIFLICDMCLLIESRIIVTDGVLLFFVAGAFYFHSVVRVGFVIFIHHLQQNLNILYYALVALWGRKENR